MDAREQELLKLAIEYKEEYETTKWWKFRKKNKAYENWQRSLRLMVKCVEAEQQRCVNCKKAKVDKGNMCDGCIEMYKNF